MPDPTNPGDRAKAFRLRRSLAKGTKLEPVDQLWIDDYTERQKRPPAGAVNRGRSRSARKINLQVEEAAEAEGEGTAASAAAVAALAAREEGRRLDALTMGSTDSLKEACAVYRDICLTLKDHWELMTTSVVETMMSLRSHVIARTQAESALIEQQHQADKEDPATQLLLLLAANHFGVPVDQLGGVAGAAAAAAKKGQQQPPRRPPPPPNGARKS